MFKGMTIDELIQSVERAEQHAREQQGKSKNTDKDTGFYSYSSAIEFQKWSGVA